MLAFDCETDGLLDELTTIHCISLQEVDENGKPLGPVLSANDHGTGELTIAQAIERLQKADRVVGHNIIGYDIPAIAKVFPGFRVKSALDTLLLSTLLVPDMKDRDFKLRKRVGDKFPGKMIGRHSLEAWGYRLGKWKGDYSEQMKAKGLDPWKSWNQDMDDYCDQDVIVTVELLAHLLSLGMPMEAIELEQAVAPIITRQQRYGFLFNKEAARVLEGKLIARRAALEDELQRLVPPWEAVKRRFVPKRNNKTRGYIAGQEVTIMETRVFNPRSRQHIAERLSALYGWVPMEFTPKGQPKIDEDVLAPLKYPIIPVLLEHFIVNKRISQLSEGDESWMNSVKKDGRIHGGVNQNAAVTGRMTHSKPNMAQVPAVGVPYGEDCRALFCVPKGKRLVGADASGLELRCLAHFMARHDGGEYAKVILEGDVHSVNGAALFGLDPVKFVAGRKDHSPLLPVANDHPGSGSYLKGLNPGARDKALVHDYYNSLRGVAKTFIYAFLYGAGDHKVGTIVGKGRKAGAELRAKFLKALPALEKLVTGVKKSAGKGWIKGLDGRMLHIRSDHAALNTLLQSAGALVMKKALVILDTRLQEAGLVPGVHYEFVGNIHDEWQIEVDEDKAEFVGKTAVESIRAAGDYFGFRCPLDGEYKVGKNWAETH